MDNPVLRAFAILALCYAFVYSAGIDIDRFINSKAEHCCCQEKPCDKAE